MVGEDGERLVGTMAGGLQYGIDGQGGEDIAEVTVVATITPLTILADKLFHTA